MTGADRTKNLLPPLGSRQDYFAFLDDLSVDTIDNVPERHRSRTLVKTYLLETAASLTEQCIERLLPEDFNLERVGDEDSLFKVVSAEGRAIVGLIEFLTPRHPAFYTLLEANDSDKLVHRATETQPDLDQVWLAAPFFQSYWDLVKRSSQRHRFMKITFEYLAAYEKTDVEAGGMDLTEASSDYLPLDEREDDPELLERRTSKLILQDRLSAVDGVLRFRSSYGPFNSMVQMRVPAAGRGGHDVYFNGKTTNRSESFVDHRQTALFLAETYQSLTEGIESRLWSKDLSERTSAFGTPVIGAPFLMEFKEELSEETFENFLNALRRKRNLFRLSGFYNRLSATKVHLNGIDRHLWQPLWLEFTRKHIVGILPACTCGNVINRLLANLQRLIDPEVDGWIGNTRYSSLVKDAFSVHN